MVFRSVKVPPMAFADTSRATARCGVEAGPGVIARQHAFERGILALNRAHRVVNDLADLRGLGLGLDGVPAGFGRQPEDIGGQILVAILGGFGAARLVFDEPFALGISETEQQLFAFFL